MTGQEMLEAFVNIDSAYIEEVMEAPKVKKVYPIKRWCTIAACLALLISAAFGTYAYASDAKEYRAATEFFGEYNLPTEGLSRDEIKAVHRDITNEEFAHEKTAAVIENSLTPAQKLEYAESQGNSSDNKAEDLWDYKIQNSTTSNEPMQPTPTEAPSKVTKDGIVYQVLSQSPGGYTVTGYTAPSNWDGKLAISETIYGLPVVAIGEDAFYKCSKLTSIVIPDSVTSIGYGAFYDCKNLVDVTLSSNLEYIDTDAFYNCTNLKYNIYDTAAYLGNADNPYTVLIKPLHKYIDQFQIHPQTKVIYSGAFFDCQTLTEITIPEGVLCIGRSAFVMCTELTKVSIPSSVIHMEQGVFVYCEKLVFNTYGNAQYLGNANNPYIVLVKAVDYNITECQIHPETKFLAASAFQNCEKLKEIVIPDGIISVNGSVFAACTSLTDITIGKNVETFSINYGCDNLQGFWVSKENPHFANDAFGVLFNKDMTTLIQAPAALSGNYIIPDSVKTIDNGAFNQCVKLTGVTIGKNVSKIDNEHIFPMWSNYPIANLTITVADSNPYYKADSYGVIYTANGRILVRAPSTLSGHYTIPDDVGSICGYAFYSSSNLESITIPKLSKNNWGYEIFSDASRLKTVYYTGTEKQWAKYIDVAFKGANIPSSVTVICSDTGKTPPPAEPTVPEPTEGNENQGGKQLTVSPAIIVIIVLVILNACTLFLLLRKKKTN